MLLLISTCSLGQVNQPVNLSLIELKFKLVFSNRDMFIRPCLVAESYCKFNATESKIGLDIINSSSSFVGIDFQSSSQSPQLFIKDAKGLYQVVGTTNQRGAVIHVNLDRLLEPLIRIVGIDKVIEYIVSGLYFQQTNNWDQSIQTAKKVGAFWKTKFRSHMPLAFNEESVEIMLFKNKEVRMMLLDNHQAHLISVDVIKRLTCTNNFIPAIIIEFGNDKWVDYQYKSNHTQGTFVTDLVYQCVDTSGKVEKWASTVSLGMHFEITPAGQKVLQVNTFRIDVTNSKKIN